MIQANQIFLMPQTFLYHMDNENKVIYHSKMIH